MRILVLLALLVAVGAVSHRKPTPVRPREVDLAQETAPEVVVPELPASHFHPNDKEGESRFAGAPKKVPTDLDPAGEFRFASARAGATAKLTVLAKAQASSREDPDKEPENLTQVPPQTDAASPYERFGASSIIRGNKLYIFGGIAKNGNVASNELIEFDIDANVWSTVDVYGENNKPPGRLFHTAVLSEDGKRMFITGGTPCFKRIFQKSLSFDDANGQYVPMLQHATTETTSIEHSQGLDDVYAFDFEEKQWTKIRGATNARQNNCKAATNVYYNAAPSRASPALAFAVALVSLCAVLLF